MPRCSIRTLMAIIIALMGLLGLLLAVSSGELHNKLAFENQRKSLVELVRIESGSLLKSLQEITDHGIIYGGHKLAGGAWDLDMSEKSMMRKHLERLQRIGSVIKKNDTYQLSGQ